MHYLLVSYEMSENSRLGSKLHFYKKLKRESFLRTHLYLILVKMNKIEILKKGFYSNPLEKRSETAARLALKTFYLLLHSSFIAATL